MSKAAEGEAWKAAPSIAEAILFATRLTLNRLEIRMGRCQNRNMKQLTAIIHQGEPNEGGFWATCLEVPGANGQGETRDECLHNLAAAVQLLLDTGREEAFRLDPLAETAELLLA
jgi:predicted RNase H-like HicB family nuclease